MSGRKRQRLSSDGRAAVTSFAEQEPTSQPAADTPTDPETKLNSKSLFVHSLPVSATKDSLAEHFSQSFPVKHATVVLDPSTKESKGYGFVTFADADDAQSATKSFNSSIFDGKKIKVELAQARHRQAAGDSKASLDQTPIRKTSLGRMNTEVRQPSKLIVRNLPWTFKQPDQLAQLFRSYGKIKYATLPEKRSGLSAGFGFVMLRGRKNAEKALEGVNGKEIEGRTLAVDWAVEKDTWDTLQKQDDNGTSSPEDSPETLAVAEDGSIAANDDTDSNSIGDSDVDSTFDSEEHLSQSEASVGSDLSTQESTKAVATLFVRNVSFTVTDDTLQDHFSSFGPVRYARIVIDPSTERSRGTAFVAFYNSEDAKSCLAGAQKAQVSSKLPRTNAAVKPSLLEDTTGDLSRQYTLDGRVLQISEAVDRGEAKRLTVAGTSFREIRDKDKRRLYLLSEGTIPSNSPLRDQLSPSEIKLREDSAKQRQALIRGNPSLHLSLTRLSVRNIPRFMTSKDLKELARKAVVGFATEVKAGGRQPLSKEENMRGGTTSKEAERARKLKGKGIVKQAKIVFEGIEGGKVQENSGAGRSRGYGFVEYTSHRWALMGLRWLNGHAVGKELVTEQQRAEGPQERKKRLILEFAIENAQVVARRHEREANARETSRKVSQKLKAEEVLRPNPLKPATKAKSRLHVKKPKASTAESSKTIASPRNAERNDTGVNKVSKRQQVIGRKRMLRKARRSGASK